jgi:uncharacterized protein (TIGR01777 family)
MRILMAGASGFLGTALRTHLAQSGHQVTQLVRGEPSQNDQVLWDPYRGVLDRAVVAASDVVINLAGAPIAHWPWTSGYKKKILQSRLQTGGTIAAAIAEVENRPAWVNASGIDYYGDRGDEALDEGSTNGSSFLAEVVRQWEGVTQPARDAGARVCMIRTSAVLDKDGGALKLMKLPFQVGVGGKFGDGRQWFPTVSLPDYQSAVTRLATDENLEGPFNVIAPVPATNGEFAKALARHLGRPCLVTVPGFAMRLAAGELSGQVLGSIRATPRRLDEAGFEFAHPTIETQLDAAFAERVRA